ncbi:MAG: hypothetical protein MJD61_00165 [Proteobacteria bacterium]|nr:hypothetical protein [Pseudomonadota bacterium]
MNRSDEPACVPKHRLARALGAACCMTAVLLHAPVARSQSTSGPSAGPEPSPGARTESSNPLSLGLEIQAIEIGSHGFDLYSDDDVSRNAGAFVGYDGMRPTTHSVLAVELSWKLAADEAQFQRQQLARLRTHTFSASLSLRHQVAAWLWPELRLGLGASLLRMQLGRLGGDAPVLPQGPFDPSLPASRYKDQGTALIAMLGLGARLETPAGWLGRAGIRFMRQTRAGLLFEAGFLLSSSTTLRLQPADLAPDAIVPRTAELGSLSRSGPYLRGSLYVRL